MSESSIKGKTLEKQVAKLINKKLGIKVTRDPRSGAGDGNKSDILDWLNQTRMHFEIKNHKTINIKEWFRQADSAASTGQTPTVVFRLNDQTILACLPVDHLLDLIAEKDQYHYENEQLKAPIETKSLSDLTQIIDQKIESGARTCRNGHLLAPDTQYCLDKKCPYSRGHQFKKQKGAKS